MKGWQFGKYYPSDFNRRFGHFVHSRLIEHDVQASDDLPVLGVPESVFDLVTFVKVVVISVTVASLEYSNILCVCLSLCAYLVCFLSYAGSSSHRMLFDLPH